MTEPLTEEQIRELKDDLIALQAALTEALNLKKDSAKTVELDQQLMGRLSRMDALQQQEMAKAGKAVQQRRLRLAEQALRAIDDETYGECRECGESIAYKRLKVSPEAPFCVECQASKEA